MGVRQNPTFDFGCSLPAGPRLGDLSDRAREHVDPDRDVAFDHVERARVVPAGVVGADADVAGQSPRFWTDCIR